MRFWIVLVALVLVALGFILVISKVNLGLQEVGSVSITTGVLMLLVLHVLDDTKQGMPAEDI